ncbi:unnamed protein product, partial [Rotaria sp. Silwood2]
DQQFSAPGAFKELDCKGRPCASCGNCRDWYFTGDSATWEWIHNYNNWEYEDFSRFRNDHVWEHFKSRDDATCNGNNGANFFYNGFYCNYDAYERGFVDDVSRAYVCLCENNIAS